MSKTDTRFCTECGTPMTKQPDGTYKCPKCGHVRGSSEFDNKK